MMSWQVPRSISEHCIGMYILRHRSRRMRIQSLSIICQLQVPRRIATHVNRRATSWLPWRMHACRRQALANGVVALICQSPLSLDLYTCRPFTRSLAEFIHILAKRLEIFHPSLLCGITIVQSLRHRTCRQTKRDVRNRVLWRWCATRLRRVLRKGRLKKERV